MTKRNKIIYWVFTIWMSLGMTSTGIGQLVKMKTGAGGADSLAHLGYPPYFLTLLGAAKILGVIAVLIPGFPRVKEWAYAGFFFMMSGAVFSHIAAGSAFGEAFPSILLLALTIISWAFRPASRKMVSVSQ